MSSRNESKMYGLSVCLKLFVFIFQSSYTPYLSKVAKSILSILTTNIDDIKRPRQLILKIKLYFCKPVGNKINKTFHSQLKLMLWKNVKTLFCYVLFSLTLYNSILYISIWIIRIRSHLSDRTKNLYNASKSHSKLNVIFRTCYLS